MTKQVLIQRQGQGTLSLELEGELVQHAEYDILGTLVMMNSKDRMIRTFNSGGLATLTLAK